MALCLLYTKALEKLCVNLRVLLMTYLYDDSQLLRPLSYPGRSQPEQISLILTTEVYKCTHSG